MGETCHLIEPLLAAFALGALDAEERLVVEAHLADCEACRAALAAYQAVGDRLALALPPVPPPPRLRARLAAKTAPRERRRRRWRLSWPQVWQASMLAALLLLGVLNLSLLRRTDHLLRTSEQLASQNQTYQAALALLTYPDTRVVVLQNGTAYGTLLYQPGEPIAVLNVEGLPEPPPGMAYQLWLIQPDETRISGGVFVPTTSDGFTVIPVHAPQPLDRFVGVGITLEPAGGSPGPTGPRVLGGSL